MKYQSVLAVDVGSTTTKALLMERGTGGFRLRFRAEAPTTVERPLENVMIGVRNAIERLEQVADHALLDDTGKLRPRRNDKEGVDLFLATSSAGGGLQMVVGGIWRNMTAESAKKAALGAGAIVMDVFAADDERNPLEKIQRIQELRPDMILLSGGVDGGNTTHVTSLAEIVALSKPQPRLGKAYTLPVVYAGNVSARGIVESFLDDASAEGSCLVKHVANLRPTLETEVLEPAREQIHELFMEHVMSHAPGYPELLEWCNDVILPTPGSVGRVIDTMGQEFNVNVLAADIGGATTDVFSSVFLQYQRFIPSADATRMWEKGYFEQVEERKFDRSVSANLGMSYSIGNILAEAGLENVARWLPFPIDEERLRDWCCNKMIRPTTLPQSLWSLIVEQAFAREALRLAVSRHLDLTTGLKGISVKRTIGDIFKQEASGQRLFRMMEVDCIVGSGGVLSHAPRRSQALSMVLDSFQPEGVTEVYVDSIFMMPQLGILSTVAPEEALEVFTKDCLVPLGTCIAPVGTPRLSSTLATVDVKYPDGQRKQVRIQNGSISTLPLGVGQTASITVRPASGVDIGEGPGKILETDAIGGQGGLILDGRNRPIVFPRDERARVTRLQSWYDALGVYPAGEERW